MKDEPPAPIIVIKKIKKHGHGHHGGAWKVAYADFVTAMMAFFLLLWLINSVTKKNLEGVAQYFTPTVGLRDQKGIGFEGGQSPVKDGIKISQYSDPSITYQIPSQASAAASQDGSTSQQITQSEETAPLSIEKNLSQAIKDRPELKDFDKRIIFDQTPEGLRIQILDDVNKPLFIPGTSELQEYTKEVLTIIGGFVKYLPNYLSVEGHTTPFPMMEKNGPDNWTLSSERANATRKFMRQSAVENEQIFRVVGKADQEPLYPENPADPRNIRLSIIILKNSIVPYQKKSFPQDSPLVEKKNTP